MADGTAAGRPKTRERILAVCQTLFNERGPADVTTAEIAATLGINEGNLYYHFQRKEQMLEALFEAFERELGRIAADREYGGDPTRYADYLRGWFGLMWEWRFFYRDGATVHRLAPGLRARIQSLSDQGQAEIRRAMAGMRAAGLIDGTPEELERVMVNAWIVSTYWIDYLRTRHAVTAITREHLDWGAAQVIGLYAPYLTPEGMRIARAGGGAPT